MDMKHIIFDCDGTLIDVSERGPRYKLFPGIKELVVSLARDHHVYVWTARDRVSTQRILEENGIFQYFNQLSTISDGPAKPHIGGLIDLVGQAGKASICVIGDSGNDIVGAKNFGVLSIGAVWNGDTNGAFLKEMGADFVVSHPAECSSLIEQNLGDDDV
jgi:phosphoglycolate phosphatase